ncbi:hypothetical protein N7510_006635 [Penicillium lagena]|uniref:uncharacterized protein n=1 Tax=Penicillium lagena TaxID=94218 RepID=UPI002540B42F|nr:uncharacterized protein N7510_006635 [Penicillium lagena]KAJ5613441.1 hypothetical protein N7510_006635 [Penicillium lagena]
MSPKNVVVVGATGAQGGSIVTELLKYAHEFHIRALTRDVKKPSALALSAQGVEVHPVDLNDSLEKLIEAFEGAEVLYGMTDFYSSGSKDIETAQGKAIADAAAATPTLKHFLWGTLPDPVKVSNGKFLNVHHWQSKADVTEYIKTKYPDLWIKTTAILFPNYFENCLTMPKWYLPKKVISTNVVPSRRSCLIKPKHNLLQRANLRVKESGIYTLSFLHSENTLLPNVSITDTGKLVRLVILNGAQYFRKSIAFYAEALSEAEKLREMGRLLGIATVYKSITPAQFQSRLISGGMSPVMALDYTEQLQIFEECGQIYDDPNLIQAFEIPGLSLKTWKEFIKENDVLAKLDQ